MPHTTVPLLGRYPYRAASVPSRGIRRIVLDLPARVRTSSRLDRYALELLALHEAGATTAELQRCLLANHMRVHYSTVARWLRRYGAR